MFRCVIFLFVMSVFFKCEGKDQAVEQTKKTICLNMIVKNESKVIKRCLNSVKPFIDYWVIIDTGSTDGTQKIIQDFMKDIPGELLERPWVDFSHNRNEVLLCSKNKADYILFMDADETLVYSPQVQALPTEKDYYFVPVRSSKDEFLSYDRFLLVNNQLNWEWKDILHEYLEIPENAKTFDLIKDIACVTDSDGSRADDPKKYHKDAAVLEKALEKDPNNSRYVFYLAQSYCNAKEYALADKYYKQRANMSGGWDAEKFWSLFVSACIQEAWEKPLEIVTEAFYKAYLSNPSRVEPIYRLAKYLHNKGHHLLSYSLCQHARTFKENNDQMYSQGWMYEYGVLCMLYESCIALEKKEEALSVLQELLSKNTLPAKIRSDCEKALFFLQVKKERT